ncbi:MAG: TrkA family potassium uptake protein [Planctomycetaceae bacterium]|nr:TrkA family potassium uptake protein [Planctomycetaceae bacterium]
MERFAIIGLGLFGKSLATRLAEAGAEVIAIDKSRDLVDDVRDIVAVAVCLDSTDEQALIAQGVDKVDVAVVGIGTHFESSALTTVILKQLGVPRVISRATSRIRADILTRIGADGVISPEEESAERWAGRLLSPSVIERFAIADGFSLAQVTAPREFWSKTLAELDLSKKHKVLAVAIRRTTPGSDLAPAQETIITAPGPATEILQGDLVVVIGPDAAIASLPQS